MKIAITARLSGTFFLIAFLITFFVQRPGLASAVGPKNRIAWIDANQTVWQLGWWFWLAAIFTWMVLLVTLAWTYLPPHRIAAMLQNGLMVIAAVLAIAGVVVWMGAVPIAVSSPSPVLAIAQGLVAAGLFMGGIVTLWIIVDLAQMGHASWRVLLPGALASALLLPSPFLFPQPSLLSFALVAHLVWCISIGFIAKWPSPYPEWT